MFVVTAFCMLSIAYVLVSGATGAPAEAAVTMAFVTLMSTVGSYVFGAVWHDTSIGGKDDSS